MALELAPELATLVDAPPAGAGWFHEAKLDGYRVLAQLAPKRAGMSARGRAKHAERTVTLRTRNGNDWTTRAPGVADILGNLRVVDAVLDGEIVVLRKDGVSDFQALQNAMRQGKQGELTYFVFDLLWLDGRDLRDLPLRERKQKLARLLGRGQGSPRVRYTQHLESEGKPVLERACKLGLEGIVSKRADSPYRGRRTMDWQKSKCSARQELVIGGYTAPSGARTHLGALLMGVREKGGLRYAGKVGTGFNQQSLKELAEKLAPLQRASSPFVDPPRAAEARDVQWVAPKLVAEIEFTEFTQDHRMRHPSFRGLREDKAASEVVEERPRRQRATHAARGGK